MIRSANMVRALSLSIGVLGTLLLGACGDSTTKFDANLLTNPSFEKVGKDGLPEGWKLASFRGLENQQVVRWAVDSGIAIDGQNSFSFTADPGTRRFLVLTQEVEIQPTTHVVLKGWIKVENATRGGEQYAQCNYLLTFYDQNHNRFQEMRFADKRTRLRHETVPWMEESHKFRVPEGTRYVAVSCILGMDGRVWFDNVSLEIPTPLPWEMISTRNFDFHWLPGHPFPAGAIDNQQYIFDLYCERLKLTSDTRIKYFLYPDTTTIREILSLKGFQYVSWDDREFHSINPNDNHEVVHFITDEYGGPPRAISEGTVFWLLDDWGGHPVDKVAAFRLRTRELPPLAALINYNQFMRADPNLTLPAAASFIGFVNRRWGVERLMELYRSVNGMNSYDPFAQAFETVYGMSALEAEEWWRRTLLQVDLSDIVDLPAVHDHLESEEGDEQPVRERTGHEGHNHD